MADLTAALSGVDVDLRRGSFLDPVVTESFDLVVSNPPFVVSTVGAHAGTHTYRDGGLGLDGACALLAREAPARLRLGGTFQMLAGWVHRRGEDWRDRVVPGRGVPHPGAAAGGAGPRRLRRDLAAGRGRRGRARLRDGPPGDRGRRDDGRGLALEGGAAARAAPRRGRRPGGVARPHRGRRPAGSSTRSPSCSTWTPRSPGTGSRTRSAPWSGPASCTRSGRGPGTHGAARRFDRPGRVGRRLRRGRAAGSRRTGRTDGRERRGEQQRDADGR
jgi:hypothetical protein